MVETDGAGSALAPYDALLLVSFGGPEGPEDVLPFLENVTRGWGIPRERLIEVAHHYDDRGGVSPINTQNRALLAAIRSDLRSYGIDVPIAWGNRNWQPYLADAVRELRDGGARRVLAFVTAAYSSYSGCRQYREDLAAAIAAVGADAPVIDKVRHYYNHPGFIEAMVDSTLAALSFLSDPERDAARLLFVTHSIPMSMAASSGPPDSGHAYERQHRDAAALVIAGVGERTGRTYDWDLAYCSRSGPPGQPWLEPDINDRLAALAANDPPPAAIVAVPIGFVSDHMEVIHDIDTEAAATAASLGLRFVRAATAGVHPAFVAMVRELALERAAVERGVEVVRACRGSVRVSHDRCPLGCCPNPRGERPAVAGRHSAAPDPVLLRPAEVLA